MSLSPEDFRTSLGSAYTTGPRVGGSCLVYMGKITGIDPCGCDGWPLYIREDKLYSGFGRKHELFPPYPHLDEESEEYREQRVQDSVELVVQIQKIRNKRTRSRLHKGRRP